MAADPRFMMQDLAPWLKPHFIEYLRRAASVSGEKIPPFHEDIGKARVAGIPEDILRAQKLIRERSGDYRPHLREAQGLMEQGSKRFPEMMQEYMNPYQQAVLDRIAEEGGRTFKERIMPDLESRFVRAGQHGSKGHREMAHRASRDLQAEILGRQAQALSHAYQQAGQLFNADMARQLEAASARAGLGGISQAALGTEVGMLGEQGRYTQQQEQALKDAAYQEYLRQAHEPERQLGVMGSALTGTPSPAVVQSWAQNPATPQTNVAGQIGQGAFSALGLLLGAGRR